MLKFKTTIDVEVCLSPSEKRRVIEWLNTQWVGSPEIKLGTKIPQGLQVAAFKLNRGIRSVVLAEIDENGNIELKGFTK